MKLAVVCPHAALCHISILRHSCLSCDDNHACPVCLYSCVRSARRRLRRTEAAITWSVSAASLTSAGSVLVPGNPTALHGNVHSSNVIRLSACYLSVGLDSDISLSVCLSVCLLVYCPVPWQELYLVRLKE